MLKKNKETEEKLKKLKKHENENWIPPAGQQGKHLLSMGKTYARAIPSTAAPEAVTGVFKLLLFQPSSFYLCLVEGRFLSVIFKLCCLIP